MTTAAVLSTPRTASAADPAAVINRIGNEGLAALGPGVPPAQRLATFRQLFAEHFDVQSISRFVLGRYWRLASESQRQEFPTLFREYITRVYSDRLAEYGGAHLQVTGVRNGPEGTIVASRLVRPNGQPVDIDWRMTQYGDTWKVADVIIASVSMAATQRSEFASVIQRNGGEVGGLIAAMRAKLGGDMRDVAETPAPARRAPAHGSSDPAYGAGVPPYGGGAPYGASVPPPPR